MATPSDPQHAAIWDTFRAALHADIQRERQFDIVRPFLAHYTSLEVLEKVLSSNEVWFSNPLFMNDLEELRFGILHGADEVRTNAALSEALGTDERRKVFQYQYQNYFQIFSDKQAFDTYVLCFSEHKNPNDHDGILSMWRGYGGNGKGAAIVFDTSKLGPAAAGGNSLVLAEVHYAPIKDRLDWLSRKVEEFAALLKANPVPDKLLYLPAYALFQRIKLFALFTKHHGFSEEREWRAVYSRENDPQNTLGANFGYLNGPRGIEPKLRFEVKPVPGLTVADFSLETLVNSILLGPTASSPLALESAKRMIQSIRPGTALADRVFASGIPFRSF